MAGGLCLSVVRERLVRMEDTIIFALLERAQYCRNMAMYTPPSSGDSTFVERFLAETERVHGRIRRYTSPDENPFFPEVVGKPALPLLNYPTDIAPNAININPTILKAYVDDILPLIAAEGSDNMNLLALSLSPLALSRRIHYGKQVAEIKFRAKQEEYSRLVRAGDDEALMLQSADMKASTFGGWSESGDGTVAGGEKGERRRLDPDVPVEVYRKYIIPLTKKVQVCYLGQCLRGPCMAVTGHPDGPTMAAANKHFDGPVEVQCHRSVAGVVIVRELCGSCAMSECEGAGTVSDTLDQLWTTPAKICGEIRIPVRRALVGCGPLDAVRRIYANDAVVFQCHSSLHDLCPGAEIVGVPWDLSTVEMASRETGAAAVTHVEGDVRGLSVLCDNVHPGRGGTDRFLVVGKKFGRDVTMLVYAIPHTPGALRTTLARFGARMVNLLSIQSCPMGECCTAPDSAWMLVELEGHITDEKISGAVDDLRAVTSTLTVLGSFASLRVGSPTNVAGSV